MHMLLNFFTYLGDGHSPSPLLLFAAMFLLSSFGFAIGNQIGDIIVVHIIKHVVIARSDGCGKRKNDQFLINLYLCSCNY